MKKRLLFLMTICAICWQMNAQINSGNPAKPFGSNTSYATGTILPSNLPTGGTYGKSQDAADAYNAWKSAYVEACGTNQYRVKFDDTQYTVSEGIAYGMLLAAYAGDKSLFDGLWAYYKGKVNGNGVMHWKIQGCNTVNQQNGATDAELDAAMALIIAAVQWPSGNYKSEAQSLIGKIKQYEMTTAGQTINGDGWGMSNVCRNPSYISPAYYTEFSKVVTAANDITFWGTTAITASNTILTNNRHATTGLVSNWCDNNGTENNCNGDAGYGFDACRNPWRMAVDYLWHGASGASTAAKDICGKLVTYVNGNEGNMKGPISPRSNNISQGQYKNGAFSMFALPPMTSSSAQTSLNSCYTNVKGLSGNDVYFNATIRCITMFVLTGNFWSPDAAAPATPTLTTATTNATGSQLILTFNKAIANTTSANGFTLYINGAAVTSAFTGATVSGQTITLTIAAGKYVVAGNTVTLSYTPGAIQSTDGQSLAAFTGFSVTNALADNNTVVANCETRETNVCTTWFDYKDTEGSTITATKDADGAILMTTGTTQNPAAVGTGYISVNFNIARVNATYSNWGVGFGFNLNKESTETTKLPVNLTGASGVTFYHKGAAGSIQIATSGCSQNFAADIPEHTAWTQVTIPFSQMQITYSETGGCPVGTALTDTYLTGALAIQFQISSGAAAKSGTFSIDQVQINNKVLTLPASCTETGCTEYAVTFNYDNGSPNTTEQVCSGTTVTRPATNPTKSGYTFDNWYTAATGGSVFNFTTTTITAPTTIYARWTQNTCTEYTVTFNYDNGNPNTTQQVCTGTTATRPATDPTKTGYTFVNWYTAATGGNVFNFANGITANTTIYARWTPVQSNGPTMIADCENGNKTCLGSYWYSFNDKANSGLSSVTPDTSDDSEFTMTAGGASGTANYARINYTLNKGGNANSPFVGMGFAMSEPKAIYDLSASTGMSFYYKGNASRLKVNMGGAGDTETGLGWNAYGYDITASTNDWKLVTITWSQLAQIPGWGTALPGGFNPALIVEFQWQVEGATGNTGWIGVDEVQITGTDLGVVCGGDLTGVTTTGSAAFAIYPNPAKDGNFNVTLSNSETAVLTIINLQGQAVYSTIVNNGAASINTNLGAGVYIVSVQSESGLKTQKLVIK